MPGMTAHNPTGSQQKLDDDFNAQSADNDAGAAQADSDADDNSFSGVVRKLLSGKLFSGVFRRVIKAIAKPFRNNPLNWFNSSSRQQPNRAGSQAQAESQPGQSILNFFSFLMDLCNRVSEMLLGIKAIFDGKPGEQSRETSGKPEDAAGSSKPAAAAAKATPTPGNNPPVAAASAAAAGLSSDNGLANRYTSATASFPQQVNMKTLADVGIGQGLSGGSAPITPAFATSSVASVTTSGKVRLGDRVVIEEESDEDTNSASAVRKPATPVSSAGTPNPRNRS